MQYVNTNIQIAGFIAALVPTTDELVMANVIDVVEHAYENTQAVCADKDGVEFVNAISLDWSLRVAADATSKEAMTLLSHIANECFEESFEIKE